MQKWVFLLKYLRTLWDFNGVLIITLRNSVKNRNDLIQSSVYKNDNKYFQLKYWDLIHILLASTVINPSFFLSLCMPLWIFIAWNVTINKNIIFAKGE